MEESILQAVDTCSGTRSLSMLLVIGYRSLQSMCSDVFFAVLGASHCSEEELSWMTML